MRPLGRLGTNLSIAHTWCNSHLFKVLRVSHIQTLKAERELSLLSNYLVYLQGGLYTDITPTVLSLPPFIEEQASTMGRWDVFEKSWAGWTSFSSQDRKEEWVAVSSSESRFYKGKINKWWLQRENPAKLTQPQRRAHRPEAGKVGLHGPSPAGELNEGREGGWSSGQWAAQGKRSGLQTQNDLVFPPPRILKWTFAWTAATLKRVIYQC